MTPVSLNLKVLRSVLTIPLWAIYIYRPSDISGLLSVGFFA